MQLHKNQAAPHAIQSYDLSHDTPHIKINDYFYSENLIVHAQHIISPWHVTITDDSLAWSSLEPLLQFKPRIMILGQDLEHPQLSAATRVQLAEQGIGVECMTLAAACRTFNILLNEDRDVVLGLIIHH